MKKNLGTTDRVIRLLLAAVVAVLVLTNQISGTVGILLGLLAVVFALTGALGFCPLYLPFNIATKKPQA